MTGVNSKFGVDKGILLEAGTNEAEFLIFELADQRFGVNVAKVKEVLEMASVTALPDGNKSIEGVVRIREDVVTLIDLARHLYGAGAPEAKRSPTDALLLLEFNGRPIAFRVHRVHRINRVSWKATRPMPDSMGTYVPVTGIVVLDGKLIQILDFESIGTAVVGCEVASNTEQESFDRIEVPQSRIVFAEDSRMISEMISDHLTDAGFSDIRGFMDGESAWNYLAGLAEQCSAEDLGRQVSILITDVEMPRMDGFTLAKHVRQHPVLSKLPIVIFSSLVSKDNLKKGAQVGVDAQVSKPRYAELVSTMRQLLGSRQAVPVLG